MKDYLIYTGKSISVIGGITIQPHTAVKIVETSETGTTSIVETKYVHQGTRFGCLTSDLIPMTVSEKTKIELDTKRVTNVVVDNVDFADYPDFCDASIVSADYDGEPMTNEQIEAINENSEFVNESVFAKIY
jgi:hypothetical protein